MSYLHLKRIDQAKGKRINAFGSALSRRLRDKRGRDVLNLFASALRANRMRGFMFGEMLDTLERLTALFATILIGRHGSPPYRFCA
jgi:hypothetical protein